MLKTDEIRLAETQTVRRYILEMLHATSDVGANEDAIRTFLAHSGHILMRHELRRHLEYLDELRAIKIIDRDRATWAAKILPYGTDIIEYAVKPPAGIAKG